MNPAMIFVPFVLLASAASAEPMIYTLDPGHSQVTFHFEHAGFSITHGMFGGFEGTITIDRDDLAASSVFVSIATDRLFTGDTARDDVLLRSGQFFDLDAAPMITFLSTSVALGGSNTAMISGDLNINGVTVPVVLETELMGQTESYPLPPWSGQPAVGFVAHTVLSRTAFNLGLFAPFIADEVVVEISVEAVVLD